MVKQEFSYGRLFKANLHFKLGKIFHIIDFQHSVSWIISYGEFSEDPKSFYQKHH